MISRNRTGRFIAPLALAGAMLITRVGADGGAGAPTVLVPDRAHSTVLIDAEGWNAPLEVRVVTLSDDPTLSIPSEDADPSALVRIATTLTHPETGERIDVNIVEVARGFGLRERGDREVAWVANNELPFTRASEIAFALDGLSVRRADDAPRSPDDQVFGWFSGTPIVELYVWRDATRPRASRANYGLQIVTSRKIQGPLSSGGDAGGATGPPPDNGPDAQGGDGDSVCGGDPGGSPGLPPCDKPSRPGRP